MNIVERAINNLSKAISTLADASKIHSKCINDLNEKILVLEARVKKIEEEKADKKEVFRFHVTEEL